MVRFDYRDNMKGALTFLMFILLAHPSMGEETSERDSLLQRVDEIKAMVDEKYWNSFYDVQYSMPIYYHDEGAFTMHLEQNGRNAEARIDCSSPEITFKTIPSVTTIEQWLAMLLHECFHGFQYQHKDFWASFVNAIPENFSAIDSLVALKRYEWYNSLLSEEHELLRKAFSASSRKEAAQLLTSLFAIRKSRLGLVKERLGLDIIRYYPLVETLEGSARYIEYCVSKELGVTDCEYMYNLNGNSYYYASGFILMLLLDRHGISYKDKLFSEYNTLEELVTSYYLDCLIGK